MVWYYILWQRACGQKEYIHPEWKNIIRNISMLIT
jgi:hypothetical protein